MIARLGSLPPLRALRELRREFDRTVLVLAAGDLVAQFGFGLVYPFFTIYVTTELGASVAHAGLIVGLYALASILSNAAGGWLADRVGRRSVMVASSILTAVVIGSMGQVHDLVWVTGLAIVLGFVSPPFIPASRAAVADVVPESQRPRAYALLGVAASVGWIAGPSIGAGLSVFGYPVLFGVAGLIIGVYAVILIFNLSETRPTSQQEPSSESAPRGAAPGAKAAESSSAGSTIRVRRVGVFGAFLVLAVLIHSVTPQWVVGLPVYAFRQLEISTATWGLLFALNGIIILVFQLRISAAWERRSKPLVIAIGMVTYLLGYLVVAAIPGPFLAVPMLLATVILVSVGEMLVFPVEPAFVADLSPAHRRGRYQGLLGAAAGLGFAIGAPIGGAILDGFRGSFAWLVFAAVAAVAGLGLVWLSRSTAAQPLGETAPISPGLDIPSNDLALPSAPIK